MGLLRDILAAPGGFRAFSRRLAPLIWQIGVIIRLAVVEVDLRVDFLLLLDGLLIGFGVVRPHQLVGDILMRDLARRTDRLVGLLAVLLAVDLAICADAKFCVAPIRKKRVRLGEKLRREFRLARVDRLIRRHEIAQHPGVALLKNKILRFGDAGQIAVADRQMDELGFCRAP